MNQTLAGIARSINISKSLIQNRPIRIFLCGGPISKQGEAPSSLRAVLMAHLDEHYPKICTSVILAENVTDWYHSPNSPRYPNLVDLETQIGALSTLILLIVESAGSIAELGAFSFIPSLRSKLTVIIESNLQLNKSFIVDGPLAALEKECKDNNRPSSWYAYSWHKNAKKPIIHRPRAMKAAEKITVEILTPAASVSRPEVFHADKLEHQILLVAGIITTCGPLLISDILEFLDGLGLQEDKRFERKKIEEYLFILGNLGHITKIRAGNYDFYVPSDSNDEYVLFHSTQGKPLKVERINADVLKYQKTLSNYEHRKLAFRNASTQKVKQ